MNHTDEIEHPNADATDRRGMRVLGFEDCLDRLRSAGVGRIGFTDAGETVMLPVNHLVDGMDIVFRTTWGAKLQVAADIGRVAFEVDGHDEGSATGWSVLVQGSATIVHDAADRRRLEGLAAAPWVDTGESTFWVRIRPEQVTGREILAPPPASAARPPAG